MTTLKILKHPIIQSFVIGKKKYIKILVCLSVVGTLKSYHNNIIFNTSNLCPINTLI